ncbi:MAG TPA: hypothetical protein VI854_08825 [Acidimicrobiia bacterium]|nr:hypothetical protein [Acidimicrobiia bacterium]
MRRLLLLAVAATLATAVVASAAELEVDGRVIQTFEFPGPASVPPECAGMRFDEIVMGTPGHDVLGQADPIGGNHAQLIFGLAGNDVLYGGNQDDCLVGGDGDDTLIGGNGKDVLDGGAGGDVLVGGNGKDILLGGDGDDTLLGGVGVDSFDGGAGTNECDASGNEVATQCSP